MKYLNIKEMAEIYRVHEDVVRNWCKAGRIKCFKIGKKWFIPADNHIIDEKERILAKS